VLGFIRRSEFFFTLVISLDPALSQQLGKTAKIRFATLLQAMFFIIFIPSLFLN
jgi:hypothetical protein